MGHIDIIMNLPDQGGSHENSTTEGSIWRATFPPNFWQPGKIVLARGCAKVIDQNSTDTLTMSLRFGDSTTVTSNDALAVSNAVDVADNDVANFAMTLQCRDVGDGTYTVVGYGVISDADASDILLNHFATVSTAFSPSDATYLDYTADWSVAHADNEVAALAGFATEIA